MCSLPLAKNAMHSPTSRASLSSAVSLPCPFPIAQSPSRKTGLSLLRSLTGTRFSFPFSSTTKGIFSRPNNCRIDDAELATAIIIQHNRKVLDALCEIKESMPFDRADVAAERIMNVIAGLVPEPSNNRTATTFPKNKWFDRECKVQKMM